MGRASDAGRLARAQPTRPLTAPPNHLPPQVVLWVELTPAQRTEYRRLLEKSYHALAATKSASGAASKGNLGWQLRLLCDHPNLNLRDPRPASLPAPGGPAAEAEPSRRFAPALNALVFQPRHARKSSSLWESSDLPRAGSPTSTRTSFSTSAASWW